MLVKQVSLKNIDVDKNRSRPLNKNNVEALAASIKNRGLMNPITLRQKNDRFILVAGLHRLAAFQKLNRETISSHIREYSSPTEFQLDEVFENVVRSELCALDRARALYDLDQIYKKKYPQLKRGGDKKSNAAKQKWLTAITLRTNALSDIGISTRSFQRAVAIWTGLNPTVIPLLHNSCLAKNQAQLHALSKEAPKIQIKIVDILLSNHPLVGTVEAAIKYIGAGNLPEPPPTDKDRNYNRLNDAWGRTSEKSKFEFFDQYEDIVNAWIKKRAELENNTID